MSYHAGLHRYAGFNAVWTFFLIFAGGMVTSTGSGLAVPDWPLSFGMLFPPMQGGVFYEHGHRMIAGVAGFLTLGLAIWLKLVEGRAWVRQLGYAALLLVIVQAILGGLTVLLKLPVAVSVAHAATAQAFFCMVVALAIVTGKAWLAWEAQPRSSTATYWTPAFKLAIATFLLIYAQILVGAIMRHLGAGYAIQDFPLSMGRIIPPFESHFVVIHFMHRALGFALAAWIFYVAAVFYRTFKGIAPILRVVNALLALILLQILLGGVAIWTQIAPVPTTVHLVTASAILATSLWMIGRVFQFQPNR